MCFFGFEEVHLDNAQYLNVRAVACLSYKGEVCATRLFCIPITVSKFIWSCVMSLSKKKRPKSCPAVRDAPLTPKVTTPKSRLSSSFDSKANVEAKPTATKTSARRDESAKKVPSSRKKSALPTSGRRRPPPKPSAKEEALLNVVVTHHNERVLVEHEEEQGRLEFIRLWDASWRRVQVCKIVEDCPETAGEDQGGQGVEGLVVDERGQKGMERDLQPPIPFAQGLGFQKTPAHIAHVVGRAGEKFTCGGKGGALARRARAGHLF